MLGDDSLFILLSAIFIWLTLRALRGVDRGWVYALSGLVLGLSIATKYSTGLFGLVILPVVAWHRRRNGWPWPKAVGRAALFWLFTGLGTSWWFGWILYHFNTIKQNGLVYGLLSPLLASGPDVSMRRVFAFFGGGAFTGQERPDAIYAGTFWDWLVYLFQTFWGVPVLEYDPLFPWAYLLVLALCLPALAGLWQVWRAASDSTRAALGVLAFIVILLLPFPVLRFFLTRNVLETGQGRHILYPAAQAIPILLVLGWAGFIETVKRKTLNVKHKKPLNLRFTFYVITPVALLVAWSLFQLAYMARVYPAPLPVQTTTFNPASIPQPLKHSFGDDLKFLGYNFQPDPDQAIINLTLYWQALNPVEQSYRTRVQLVDPQGRPRFTWLSHPLNGRYPTRAWDKGDVVRDTLPLPLAAVPPNHYRIQVDLLHEAADTPLNAEPFEIIQFDLPARQPIANASTLDGVAYRLWTAGGGPARHRQTLVLSWDIGGAAGSIENPKWFLVGPDNVSRPSAVTGDATAIFIVAANWPGGDYRLRLEHNGQTSHTGPLLTVAVDPRLFALPQPLEGFQPVDAVFAGVPETQPHIKLLGYTLPTRRAQPGGGLPLTLYWQSLTPVLDDTVTFAVLLSADQQPYGSADRYPSGYYSPILWAAGEIVPDEFTLGIRPQAPPGIYTVHIGQYRRVNGQPESLPLLHQGQPTGQTAVVIGPIKVGGPPPGVVVRNPQPQVGANQSFGGQITLLGYDLQLSECANGECANSEFKTQNLKLTLYWRADTPPVADYTVFLHLRNAAGETVTQKDGPPAHGAYPTGLWDTGEIITDNILLPLAGLPPGEYTPVIGLYNLVDGARLAVPGAANNEFALQPVSVGEQAHDK
jgi:hypothetical protein